MTKTVRSDEGRLKLHSHKGTYVLLVYSRCVVWGTSTGALCFLRARVFLRGGRLEAAGRVTAAASPFFTRVECEDDGQGPSGRTAGGFRGCSAGRFAGA